MKFVATHRTTHDSRLVRQHWLGFRVVPAGTLLMYMRQQPCDGLDCFWNEARQAVWLNPKDVEPIEPKEVAS